MCKIPRHHIENQISLVHSWQQRLLLLLFFSVPLCLSLSPSSFPISSCLNFMLFSFCLQPLSIHFICVLVRPFASASWITAENYIILFVALCVSFCAFHRKSYFCQGIPDKTSAKCNKRNARAFAFASVILMLMLNAIYIVRILLFLCIVFIATFRFIFMDKMRDE